MQYTIQSGAVRVQVTEKGAMLTSVQKDGVEYLWQGDPAYWAGQAPVCFPICGTLIGDRAVAFGKPCAMRRHGIARISPFSLEKHGANEVSFVQVSDENTRAMYPFDYRLRVRYVVLADRLTCIYEVQNTGGGPMPFVIGGHPAFNCPLVPGEDFSDYAVTFDKPVEQAALRPDVHTGLVDVEKRFSVLQSGRLALTHELFVQDALIFDRIAAKSATLMGPGGRGVRLDFQDFDNLLVWSSANGGSFVALEPWSGISNCSDEDEVLEHKRGMTVLSPGEVSVFHYTITLLA